MPATRRERRALAADNRKMPRQLSRIPREEWPAYRPHGLTEVWRSRDFLVQVFSHEACERLSVCRTSITGDRWTDNIAWDDLQRLKRECGRGDQCAVEIFPPDAAVVNVSNMRHIWLCDPPPFMWRRR
ncbi:MAG TPA: hypothetical protein DHW63_07890 [Hyphomonadaceae bacterium]|nr:hypothetical protein [Hyphomonadaceae bacterium]